MTTCSPLTIFFVNDDPDVRTLTAHYVKKEFPFVRIFEFTTAEAALNEIEHRVPDAVVTDYILPQMQGTQFVKLIRARLPRIPIIMISGFEAIAHEAVAAGANLFLPSSSIIELGKALHELIDAMGGEPA